MPEFAAIVYEPTDVRTGPLAQSGEYYAGYAKFAELAAASIRGGAALEGADTATTIHVTGGEHGDLVITDGPYAETKEWLGGFFVVEADDLDAAIAIARQIPAAWRDGGRVEVRPLMPMMPN